MKRINPFAGIHASELSDDKINSLWVEFGTAAIEKVIEPHSKTSKFILGGKGSGKTHLLRYHSYPVTRLRESKRSGLEIVAAQKFLAVFLRAVGVDAARFDASAEDGHRWQQLFGIYLELRLVEKVIEALVDIQKSSPGINFNDEAFITELSKSISSVPARNLTSVTQFLEWVIETRKEIDDAVNNAAFTNELNVKIPFNLTAVVLNISKAIGAWHPSLSDISLIYLIDEIENFSALQQEVVNTFIRYGEGQATFRVTGRLYAVKTYSTLGSGERNTRDAEFKTEYLDEKLRNFSGYPAFAKKFVAKHLYSVGAIRGNPRNTVAGFDPRFCFEEISSENFYSDVLSRLKFSDPTPNFIKSFSTLLEQSAGAKNIDLDPAQIVSVLTEGFPVLLQKLNILVFCKRLTTRRRASVVVEKLCNEAREFLFSNGTSKGPYSRAYGHYSGDLFAQLLREAKNSGGVPYAGFDTFIKMSAGNPRNLLIILGRAYDIASYREIDFINNGNFPIFLQTEAAIEAATFAYEKDASFGLDPERARLATGRLATVLRTARYALKIPEVSPLTVSFSEEDLTHESSVTIALAKHYSFIFDIAGGRPDRNSQRLNRKLQLNPMMAPKWGLPLGRRGDLKLNRAILNAIFDPTYQDAFDGFLKRLEKKWNSPFKESAYDEKQEGLF
jgi:hypothetical protein